MSNNVHVVVSGDSSPFTTILKLFKTQRQFSRQSEVSVVTLFSWFLWLWDIKFVLLKKASTHLKPKNSIVPSCIVMDPFSCLVVREFFVLDGCIRNEKYMSWMLSSGLLFHNHYQGFIICEFKILVLVYGGKDFQYVGIEWYFIKFEPCDLSMFLAWLDPMVWLLVLNLVLTFCTTMYFQVTNTIRHETTQWSNHVLTIRHTKDRKHTLPYAL